MPRRHAISKPAADRLTWHGPYIQQQLVVLNASVILGTEGALPLSLHCTGQPSELSGDPFKAPADTQQQQHQEEEERETPQAAAAAADGPKRFSDDTPSGPDVAASPATGWAEVYGCDLEDETAAAGAGEQAAAAAAADGGSSPTAATAVAAAGAEAAAGGVGGVEGQEGGDVPFFFMDAYEAPERPGEALGGGAWRRGGGEGILGSEGSVGETCVW